MVKSESFFNLIFARIMGFLGSLDKLLILKLPTGSGKTTNALKAVNSYIQGHWIYLSPFHRNIEENIEMSPHLYPKPDYIHMKSRAKSCIVPQYRELAKKYLNIRPICENRCDLKEDGCPYYEAKKRLFENPCNWAGVHHHITEFLGDFLYSVDPKNILNHEYYDVLLVDENPINVLFINEKGNAESLAKLRSVLVDLALPTPEAEKCNRLLEYLILNYLTKDSIDYDILYKLFSAVDFRSLYEEYQIEIIDRVLSHRMELREIPKDFLVWFDRIQKYATRNKIENMIVKKEASGYTRKHFYFMCFEETVLHNLPFKIIALDGTANIDIWESILGEKATIFDSTPEYKNMYQLTTGEYPLASWLKPVIFEITSSGIRLCGIIDKIAKRKRNKVLVICTKSLQRHIRQNCKAKNLIFGYYYYLRSRNDFYQVADTVILACQPNIPQFQLECFAGISSWDADVWRQIFTDEEMVQGVGRLRFDIPVVRENKRNRERREIYIFPKKGGSVNPFEPWSKKMEYHEMSYYAEHGKTWEDKVILGVDYMCGLVPEEGIYSTNLRKIFKQKTGETDTYVNPVFRSFMKELREVKQIVRKKRIYPRDVKTIKGK